MVRYKNIFQKMLFENEALFLSFNKIHDLYLTDSKRWKKEFNEEGQKVLSVIRRYENLLCGKSENCGYGNFSSNLSGKFWEEVKQYFPKIDDVGVE